MSQYLSSSDKEHFQAKNRSRIRSVDTLFLEQILPIPSISSYCYRDCRVSVYGIREAQDKYLQRLRDSISRGHVRKRKVLFLCLENNKRVSITFVFAYEKDESID